MAEKSPLIWCFHPHIRWMGRIDLREFFSRRKADDTGGLSPSKEDNAAAREKDRKGISIFIGYEDQLEIRVLSILWATSRQSFAALYPGSSMLA